MSDLGKLFCLCFKAMFRQLSLFWGKITHIRLQSLFSQTKCKHEEEQRTINMEEGQKGNSGTWTFEDIRAQKLVAVYLEM